MINVTFLAVFTVILCFLSGCGTTHDDTGEYSGLADFHHDVTRRKQNVRDLSQNQQKNLQHTAVGKTPPLRLTYEKPPPVADARRFSEALPSTAHCDNLYASREEWIRAIGSNDLGKRRILERCFQHPPAVNVEQIHFQEPTRRENRLAFPEVVSISTVPSVIATIQSYMSYCPQSLAQLAYDACSREAVRKGCDHWYKQVAIVNASREAANEGRARGADALPLVQPDPDVTFKCAVGSSDISWISKVFSLFH